VERIFHMLFSIGSMSRQVQPSQSKSSSTANNNNNTNKSDNKTYRTSLDKNAVASIQRRFID
jgi:hypothetical protein